MSWSLQLHNGDFTVGGAQLGTVIDEQKLVQDLRCALLEPMGTDDMHLDFGSLIDGGRLPDGSVVPSLIGVGTPTQVGSLTQSEIQRVTRAYQNQQLNRAKADQTTYNRVSLSPAEVLLNVADISITQVQDTIQAVVTLQTARGTSLTVLVPLLTNAS